MVIGLEMDLLRADVRSDPAKLDRLIHRDFMEIGASGTRWNKESIIEALLMSPGTNTVVTEVDARTIRADLILIIYRTTSPEREVHRSSWWVRSSGDWKVLFHQGTQITTA